MKAPLTIDSPQYLAQVVLVDARAYLWEQYQKARKQRQVERAKAVSDAHLILCRCYDRIEQEAR